ncbi:hypothetical protein PtrV1_05146 [Pyrenophora tritici-repentis]|uniref:Uncharacterized protein n=1 Tax=Pyrenophora tritici-repentis TaxID=45151 RepID=A0A317AGQ3_9PLEO|nr:hypothetical protein PtrV1_05146 [Pyrenophora tritici-repentis]KAI0571714.1 hypothetical protein Alg215_10227 [Pyrenophora tritici-repentis]KAI1507440.1 hypothetical protein Ptr86124_013617 [Pyrenophora tritici-repentis]KAI1526273.1 hypothetical protein PtrSN001A_010005 [Pyrenophora tritici-repentis]KAI1580521.1 hypothetical protein PtrEW13061_009973 [Pyrenophora tritici-repentis]
MTERHKLQGIGGVVKLKHKKQVRIGEYAKPCRNEKKKLIPYFSARFEESLGARAFDASVLSGVRGTRLGLREFGDSSSASCSKSKLS